MRRVLPVGTPRREVARRVEPMDLLPVVVLVLRVEVRIAYRIVLLRAAVRVRLNVAGGLTVRNVLMVGVLGQRAEIRRARLAKVPVLAEGLALLFLDVRLVEALLEAEVPVRRVRAVLSVEVLVAPTPEVAGVDRLAMVEVTELGPARAVAAQVAVGEQVAPAVPVQAGQPEAASQSSELVTSTPPGGLECSYKRS